MQQPISEGAFAPGEIAVVCARYEIAAVVRADPLGGGAATSPKVVLTCDDGRRLLLKRRGPGHDDPELVRFTHELQQRLAAHNYPVAPMQATRDGQTMLVLDGRIYELFGFVQGRAYDRSVAATQDAGRGLGFFHKILTKHIPAFRSARSTYHDATWVREALATIAGASEYGSLVRSLRELYSTAAAEASRAGLSSWPEQIIHADWHPGNMLFRKARVVAVLDYDSARRGTRAVDAASGGLQFSLRAGRHGPAEWPESADLARLRAFFAGYESVAGCTLSKAEVAALAWLMVEALIAEGVAPMAREGRFGTFEGGEFLRALSAKASWIARHRDEIRNCLNT
jgi:homoserine kinase type II